MARSYDQDPSTNVNLISSGTTFKGDIVTTGDIRIDGAIKGNINSKAKVIIGQSGIVEGDIVCQNIDIEGMVKANINVEGLLSLKATATLLGNVTVGKIAIEPEANFMGNCRMHHACPEAPGNEQGTVNPNNEEE